MPSCGWQSAMLCRDRNTPAALRHEIPELAFWPSSGNTMARCVSVTANELLQNGAAPGSGRVETLSAQTVDSRTCPFAAGRTSHLPSPDTRSGLYFYPRSRCYGKTKQGRYMTLKESRSKGFRRPEEIEVSVPTAHKALRARASFDSIERMQNCVSLGITKKSQGEK